MQAVTDTFLLAEVDSASEEETSPGKRKRRTIKSGKLRTQDTHVVIRIKWPHEVVSSAQGKVPVYEEMSLAAFTNGYLGLMAKEKGSPMGGGGDAKTSPCSITKRGPLRVDGGA